MARTGTEVKKVYYRPRDEVRAAKWFWSSVGFIVGVLFLISTLMIDSFVIAALEHALQRSACQDGFDTTTVTGIIVTSVVVSVVVGAWAFRFRKFVGVSDSLETKPLSEVMRRSFTRAMMGTYIACMLPSWILVATMAFCGGGK